MKLALILILLLSCIICRPCNVSAAFVVDMNKPGSDSVYNDGRTLGSRFFKPALAARQFYRDKYRGRLSTVHGRKGTSIAAASMSVAAILIIAIGAASGAYFMAFIFGALLVVCGFATGLAALINRCPLKGLAIFSVCLFGCLILWPLIIVVFTP